MEAIKDLFDQQKKIYRTIEKVITYEAAQEARLKAEISEYIATDHIEEQFERLLEKMQLAMDDDGEHEIGVWVSGFYGSGKSSFTKYLGLAFDQERTIDGLPFFQYLQDRFHKPQTRALLSKVVKTYPAAVVMLDLASEMLAGATMEDISTVLYYKVLQWAGYSRNLKVAAFERRLKKDGRYDEFRQQICDNLEVEWERVQNDSLVVDSLIPDIAHQMYPDLFRTPNAFSTATGDTIQFENQRVAEMLDIIRETSGKQHILFIIDEVGQYVGSRQNLILNLDGLAKNLKSLGRGKARIFGTAQQTLTQDDPRASLNSPELFKLKDRFPIQIDLESHDIKEICVKRLLSKDPQGAMCLEGLFEQAGQRLRHNTRLENAKYYDSDFGKTLFVDLYPFLPAHFDILLHLLGALARATGGIGLRSAIKIVQDILVEGAGGHAPFAEQAVGALVTSVTLYDTLEKEIKNSGRHAHLYHIIQSKVKVQYPDSDLHQGIAKTVVILQILDNLPVTPHNTASLMHPAVDAASRKEEVLKAVDELIKNPRIPFGEQDGNLCFFSEKLNDIELERAQLPLRQIDLRRIYHDALRELFTPLPSIRLHQTFSVKTGLRSRIGEQEFGLAGEREPIQTVVKLVKPGDYDTARTALLDESRHQKAAMFLLGRATEELDKTQEEIFRCKDIVNKYGRDPDAEVKEYCRAQNERAARLEGTLQNLLRRVLMRGSFLVQGETAALDSLAAGVSDACKQQLAITAELVFDRYTEAPQRVKTSQAEAFLRTDNLNAVTTELDPLGLVRINSGTPCIQREHKALTSIRDYLNLRGKVEGKQLTGHFSSPPFGWSQDTIRYLVAALLVAGDIKLTVSGRDVTVNGQQAVEALKTNNSFKRVGVALRLDDRPSDEALALAAEHLSELIGEQVLPLEEDISKKAARHLPQLQSRFAPLGEKLRALELPGVERIEFVNQEIEELLCADASDAPHRFGSAESALYEALQWARDVDVELTQRGLENTIRTLQQHRREILALPDFGIPGELRRALSDDLERGRQRLEHEHFYRHAQELNTLLTTMCARTREAAANMRQAQRQSLKDAEQTLSSLPEWQEFTPEEQRDTLRQLETLAVDAPRDLSGLKLLINQEFVLYATVQEAQQDIISTGQERVREKEKERRERAHTANAYIASVPIPAAINTLKALNDLLRALEQVRAEALKHEGVDIRFTLREQMEKTE